MAFKDPARFYKIGGEEYPSVTTILQVVNKPALGPWYAKQERDRVRDGDGEPRRSV